MDRNGKNFLESLQRRDMSRVKWGIMGHNRGTNTKNRLKDDVVDMGL